MLVPQEKSLMTNTDRRIEGSATESDGYQQHRLGFRLIDPGLLDNSDTRAFRLSDPCPLFFIKGGFHAHILSWFTAASPWSAFEQATVVSPDAGIS
jgi:hypothetical protein